VSVAAILSPERIFIAGPGEAQVPDKAAALERLSHLFARASVGRGAAPTLDQDAIQQILVERERQHSTGVGGGVAIPHGAVESLDVHLGALLVVTPAIPFAASDGQPVSLVFGLLGPRGAAAQHLKLLARIARLLRDDVARARLLAAGDAADAFERVRELERGW